MPDIAGLKETVFTKSTVAALSTSEMHPAMARSHSGLAAGVGDHRSHR